MILSARFASALDALPSAVRERLAGDSEIDWDSLADQATASGIDKATRRPTRLPPAVESLAERLIADVGIAPPDVVGCVRGSGIAGTWITAVAIEPDGERYRVRIKRTGELLPGVRPSALAGYAVLGMELATTIQLTRDAWTRAGERQQAAPDSRDDLTQCATRMFHRLRPFQETVSRPPSTLALARSMEDTWNAQTLQVREALARRRLAGPWETCAPRAHYYAVESSYRLHAFDIAEARWLQALAEHAAGVARPRAGDDPGAAGVGGSPPEQARIAAGDAPRPAQSLPSGTTEGVRPGGNSDAGGGTVEAGDDGAPGSPADAQVRAEREAGPALDDPSLDQVLKSGLAPAGAAPGEANGERPDLEVHPAPEQRAVAEPAPGQPDPAPASGGQTDTGASLSFGTAMEVRSPGAEVDLLVQAAQRVPAAVTRRLGEAYGDSVVELLGRLQDPEGIRDLREALGTEPPGNAVLGWLEELAAKLLLDTGAQTQDGQRSGPARLDPERLAEGRRVGDVTSSATGILRAIDVIEQARLSLGFASDTWSALTLLGDAGKEAEWTLRDAAVKQARLTSAERTRLEATQRIGHELQRIRRARADGSSSLPSALEEAALVASVLKSLQPSERTDAGWPAEVGLPNPHDPGDIARVAATAESLHRDVRAIANRLIAAWVADGRAGQEMPDG